MPKRLSNDLDDRLLRFLAEHPEGIGIGAIVAALGQAASRRSLQRRLTQLATAGRVRSAGEARALRYHLAPTTGTLDASMPSFTASGDGETRLAANISFIKHSLCPLSFIDVPDRAYIDGLLAIYELNLVELLRDVYVGAYERSARRYMAVRQSLGDLIRSD